MLIIESTAIWVLSIIVGSPFLVYAYLYFYKKDSPYFEGRCFFELLTGLICCLLAYESWVFIIIFYFLSIIDITKFSINYGLVFLYFHAALFIQQGPNPFLGFLPFTLAISKIIRIVIFQKSTTPTNPKVFVPCTSIKKNEWKFFFI